MDDLKIGDTFEIKNSSRKFNGRMAVVLEVNEDDYGISYQVLIGMEKGKARPYHVVPYPFLCVDVGEVE